MKSVKFLGCHIDLREKVLIPRAETEFWVREVLKKLSFPKEAKLLKVLDIFAGSGCIGIFLLKKIKNSRVDFIDIDGNSVRQIHINLKLNKISQNRYKVFRSDLFGRIKSKYDYIFANPPYVATSRISEVQRSVLEKEPHTALFAGERGLDVIEIFLKQAKKYLNKKGVIFLEFDPKQMKEIKIILKKKRYKKYKFFKDQYKKYRYLKCC